MSVDLPEGHNQGVSQGCRHLKLDQQVSTFKHIHKVVGKNHLFTQYYPENSFSSLTHGLLVGQLGFINVSHQEYQREAPRK